MFFRSYPHKLCSLPFWKKCFSIDSVDIKTQLLPQSTKHQCRNRNKEVTKHKGKQKTIMIINGLMKQPAYFHMHIYLMSTQFFFTIYPNNLYSHQKNINAHQELRPKAVSTSHHRTENMSSDLKLFKLSKSLCDKID